MSFRGYLASLFAAVLLLLIPAASAQAASELTVPLGLSKFGNVYLNSNSERTFTLYSTGSDPVTISSVSIYPLANNSEYFTLRDDNCSGQTLPPLGSCQVKVKFAPTEIDFKYTSVQVAHNGSGGFSFFGIDGVGINPGISVDPTSRDFGSVEMSSAGSPTNQTFTVANDGTTDLEVFSINVTGDDAEDFDVINGPQCNSLAPNGTCQIQIQFSPSGEPGDRSASLVLGNNTQNENPKTVPLTGKATVAHLAVDPTSINFGDVDPSEGTTPSRILELRSDGTAALSAMAYFGDLNIGPPKFKSGPFSINSANCYGTDEDRKWIAPGQSCDLTVIFDPSDSGPGTYSETLRFLTNGNTIEVPLSAKITYGEASVDKSEVDVGDVEVGESGTAKIKLTSSGTAPLNLVNPVVTGPSESMFSVEQPSSCTGMTTGQSCDLTVSFSPTAIAGKLAYLELQGNFGMVSVTLRGRGIQAYVNSPFEISFSKSVVGKSVTQDYSLLSNGDAPFNLGQLKIEGAGASSFSVKVQDGGCSGLVRGEECHFNVTYKPTSAGSHEAELKVIGNIETQTIPISGSARALTPAKVSVKLSGPKQAQAGKTLKVKARIVVKGEAKTGAMTLRTAVSKKLARPVKPIRIGSISPGKTITRTIKIKVKGSVRNGQKLKVTVTASGSAIKPSPTTRIWRMRKRPEIL